MPICIVIVIASTIRMCLNWCTYYSKHQWQFETLRSKQVDLSWALPKWCCDNYCLSSWINFNNKFLLIQLMFCPLHVTHFSLAGICYIYFSWPSMCPQLVHDVLLYLQNLHGNREIWSKCYWTEQNFKDNYTTLAYNAPINVSPTLGGGGAGIPGD